MVTVDSSWMDDVIDGKDPSVPVEDGTATPLTEPVSPGDGSSIKVVVDSFLNQRHLFTHEDLESYVNNALQVEGGEMIANRVHAKELSDSWDGYAENLRSGLIPEESASMSAEDAETKRDQALADFEMGYTEGRRLLAETVVELHDANEIALTPETWNTLAELDDDGWMSECLGFDAQTARLAAVEVAAKQTEAAVATPLPTFIDFSRDVTEPVVLFLPGKIEASPTTQPAQRASSGPTKVGGVLNSPEFTAGWSQASRDKLAVALMDHETNKAEAGGPELG